MCLRASRSDKDNRERKLIDNCRVTRLLFPSRPWWLPQPTLFFSTFVSALSSSIISQLQKKLKDFCKQHLTPWEGLRTAAGGKRKAALRHVIHGGSRAGEKIVEQCTFSFICCTSPLPVSYQSASVCALSAHCALEKIRRLSADRYTDHLLSILKQTINNAGPPFERSDSVLATLRAFTSGKSAAWTIWAS